MCLNASNSLFNIDTAEVASAKLPLLTLDGVDDKIIQSVLYAQWQDGASETLVLVNDLGDDG